MSKVRVLSIKQYLKDDFPMTIAKVQHYVPQFLLRNFGNGKKDQVWVFDKLLNRSFRTNTKGIASESRFYNFEYQGQILTLETWLSEIEGKAKSVFSNILEVDNLTTLSDLQRDDLVAFLATQLTRTKTFREEWAGFPRMLREKLGINTADVVQFEVQGQNIDSLVSDLTENEVKEQTAKIIFESPKTYGKHFKNKEWVLVATSRKHPFILSDNPLVRQNMIERSHRGNLGLMCRGIEIYYPLSPTRALVMWCPTLTEMIHRRALEIISAIEGGAALENYEGIIGMSSNLLSGKPLSFSEENVENLNSLQVAWGERFIISHTNDFELAKSMLTNEPNLRSGPRASIQ